MKYTFTSLLTAFLIFSVISTALDGLWINAGFFTVLLGLYSIHLRWQYKKHKKRVKLI